MTEYDNFSFRPKGLEILGYLCMACPTPPTPFPEERKHNFVQFICIENGGSTIVWSFFGVLTQRSVLIPAIFPSEGGTKIAPTLIIVMGGLVGVGVVVYSYLLLEHARFASSLERELPSLGNRYVVLGSY